MRCHFAFFSFWPLLSRVCVSCRPTWVSICKRKKERVWNWLEQSLSDERYSTTSQNHAAAPSSFFWYLSCLVELLSDTAAIKFLNSICLVFCFVLNVHLLFSVTCCHLSEEFASHEPVTRDLFYTTRFERQRARPSSFKFPFHSTLDVCFFPDIFFFFQKGIFAAIHPFSWNNPW